MKKIPYFAIDDLKSEAKILEHKITGQSPLVVARRKYMQAIAFKK